MATKSFVILPAMALKKRPTTMTTCGMWTLEVLGRCRGTFNKLCVHDKCQTERLAKSNPQIKRTQPNPPSTLILASQGAIRATYQHDFWQMLRQWPPQHQNTHRHRKKKNDEELCIVFCDIFMLIGACAFGISYRQAKNMGNLLGRKLQTSRRNWC